MIQEREDENRALTIWHRVVSRHGPQDHGVTTTAKEERVIAESRKARQEGALEGRMEMVKCLTCICQKGPG